jgi:hypothetical protein
MIHMEKNQGNQGHGADNGKGNDIVKIFINDLSYSIHRGHQTIAAIKEIAGVSSLDILYLMPDYIELDNSGAVTIKGGEHFKPVPPSGSSS